MNLALTAVPPAMLPPQLLLQSRLLVLFDRIKGAVRTTDDDIDEAVDRIKEALEKLSRAELMQSA